jgi:hypothetical protein
MNFPDRGIQTVVTASVVDPNGDVPTTIESLTVVGPDGFNHTYTPDEYDGYIYRYETPGRPTDGEYTFTMTDDEGKTATTHWYLKVGNTIPLPDTSTMQASGDDPLAPTLSWGADSGYEGNLFYRARIYDETGGTVWGSWFSPDTSANVPSGILLDNTNYQWRVQVMDTDLISTSNNWTLGEMIPLSSSINNNRPYFVHASVLNQHGSDGTFRTMLYANVVDPDGTLPGSITSFTVTGPGGFSHTFQPGDFSGIYISSVGNRPLGGIYEFTLTDEDGNSAVTYDYVTAQDVPLVDINSLQASGDPLAPNLSWAAPVDMDQSLYYRAAIYDESGQRVWWSNRSQNTWTNVEPGILQNGVSYQWNVWATDDKRFVHESNRSITDRKDLVIDDPDTQPYFRWATVYKNQESGQLYTDLVVQIEDPNGILPDDIVSLTVDGPGDFSHTFQPQDYIPGANVYSSMIQSAPSEGVYTFTVVDNEGNSSVTYDYLSAVPYIPSVEKSSILISGNPMAPTVSWGGISGYPGRLYYRIRVEDLEGNVIYRSGRGPDTVQTIPDGIIEKNTFYQVIVQAYDHPDHVIYNSASNSYPVFINRHIGISGQVFGGESAGGKVYVIAVSDILTLPPVAQTEADDQGNYLLGGIPNGNYYIFAFRDVDDGAPSYGEYQGYYYVPGDPSSPAQVTFSGSDVTINIIMWEPPILGPEISQVEVVRVQLPSGTGPTEAGGLHGVFKLKVAENTASPSLIKVEYPDGSMFVDFASLETDGEGFYVHMEPLSSIPQGDYDFLAMGANYVVDIEEKLVTTQTSAMPSTPTLTEPGDAKNVQVGDATSWPTFTWTGGIEGKPQKLVIASNASMSAEVFSKEVTTGTYSLQTGDASLTEANTYYWYAGVSDNTGENWHFSTVSSFTVDNTPPVITLIGTSPVTVEVGTGYNDLGVSATDTLDGDITGSIVTVNPVDTDTIGTYTVTYNVSDAAGNPAAEVTRAVTVLTSAGINEVPDGYVDGTPSTYPILTETTTLTAADVSGSRTYDWVVTDWNNDPIGSPTTGTTSYEVDPDVLLASNGAGIYTVTMTDHDNPGFKPATLNVRVPMKFIAAKFNADEGTYNDNQGTDTFTVSGGPSGNVYNYIAYDLNGNEVTIENCGSITDASPTDNDNVFNFTNPIAEVTAFKVWVMLDSASTDPDVQADVKRLIDAELDEVWSGIFRVVPVIALSGTVVDADGVTGIENVLVTFTYDGTEKITDANGGFTFTGIQRTGATYTFFLWKDGYVGKIVTADEILSGPITLEAIGAGGGTIVGIVTLSDDPTPYESGTVSIEGRAEDGTYLVDGDGKRIEVLAHPSFGLYSLPVPADFGAAGPFTLEFRKDGYILGETVGVVLGATNADITLDPMTIISVTGTPNDSDQDGTFDEVLVKIMAKAGLAPLEFDGTPTEIQVLGSDGLPIALDAFESVGIATKTWSYTHSAYENFSITVYADVSEDRDVDAGYRATKVWDYIKSCSAPAETFVADPVVTGGTGSSTSGDTDVTIPPGGLTGEVHACTIAIIEADAGEAGAAQITGSDIVEVVLIHADGEEMGNEDIQRVEITIKFDPTVVTEGSFEDGTFVVYQADSMVDMIAGNATPVPLTQFIIPIDYPGGFATFWVNHLSAFGVGAAPAAAGGGGGAAPAVPAPAGGGGGGGCFVDTLTGGWTSNVILLLVILLSALVVFSLLAQRRRM